MENKDIVHRKEDVEWFDYYVKSMREQMDREASEFPFDEEETLKIIKEYESGHKWPHKFVQRTRLSPLVFRMRSKKTALSFCLSFLFFFMLSVPFLAHGFSHSATSRFATNSSDDYQHTIERIDQIFLTQ